jgi:pimeloyl-ACP methyl ester carboxylesterase
VTLSGTSPQGSYSSLGPIERVPVPLLSPGAIAPPVGQPLLPYSSGTALIGFRQFGSGPDLVLVMGQHGTMTWWDPQLLNDLAAHFRVTIFDLPGVGYSAALAASPTVESYADATAGLIYSLQLKKPTVLGWGLGGAVTIALAERHPRNVGHIVLIDTMVGGSPSLGLSKVSSGVLGSSSVTLGAVANLMFPTSQSTVRQAWLSRILQVSPDDIVANGVRAESKAVAELASDRSITRGLSAVKSAALVIDGSVDAVVPTADSTRAATLLAKRKVDLVSGAGYGVLVQDEAAVASAIVGFATPS